MDEENRKDVWQRSEVGIVEMLWLDDSEDNDVECDGYGSEDVGWDKPDYYDL